MMRRLVYLLSAIALFSCAPKKKRKPPAPPVAATPESRYPHSRVRPAIRGGALNRGNLPAQIPSVPSPAGTPAASN